MRKEEGYIADELQSKVISEIDRKCIIVTQSVREKDFTLEEALKIYKVPQDAYVQFIANSIVDKMMPDLGFVDKKNDTLVLLKVINKVYTMLFNEVDPNISEVNNHNDQLQSLLLSK